MKWFRGWAAAAVCGALSLVWIAADSRAESNDESEKIWKQIQALHWVQGPNNVRALQNATFQVPGKFVFLDTGESDDFLRLTENVPGVPEQIFAPSDFHWWASIDFSDDGYVKDEEKLDNDAILKSIKEGTEQANEERHRNGWGELHVAGWRTAPHYDTATKRLEWALDLKDEKGRSRPISRQGCSAAAASPMSPW